MKSEIPLISFGNEDPIKRALAVGGDVAFANEARFTAAYYSVPLTEYTVGWRDTEKLQETLDYIAPPVPVSRRFEFKAAKNEEAFLSETDDERSIGSGFKRVEYRGNSVNSKTRNRGLTARLDLDEDGGATTEESIVARLTTRILRNKLRRAMTVLQALDAGTAKTWNNAATPDEDMRAAIAAAQLDSGAFPNRGIISLSAWNLRKGAYTTQNNAGAYASLSRSVADVAADLGLDELRTSREVYQLSANAKARIMGSSVVFFYAVDGLGKDDPSHVKQFYTPIEGGRWRVYREPVGPKFIDITVEHYDEIVGTATVGAKKLAIS